MIKHLTCALNITDMYGETLDDLFDKIRHHVNNQQLKGTINSVEFTYKHSYGDSVDVILEINYSREETEEEKAEVLRVQQVAERLRKQQYEKLRKEFEKE